MLDLWDILIDIFNDILKTKAKKRDEHILVQYYRDNLVKALTVCYVI